MSKQENNPWAAYSVYLGATIQMALTIGVFVYGGIKLDEVVKTEFPLFTLILSLVGVGLGLYIFIKRSYKK